MNEQAQIPDIEAFKRQVAAEWGIKQTADAWQKHYPRMRKQFEDVTKTLAAAADLNAGMSVLDLASGTGDPSITIAKLVGPNGSVTATDLNPNMLEVLVRNASGDGVSNMTTRQCDAHELPFDDAAFDRVTSRFGIMFFAETVKALKEVARVLKPGGRATFMVWGPPAPGTYFGMVGLPFMKRLPNMPNPDGPGPMRFAEPGKLVAHMVSAGFEGVTETSHSISAPYDGTPEQLIAETMEIAVPFQKVYASLPEQDRREAEQEVLDGLRAAQRDGFIQLLAPVIVVTGTTPA